MDNSLVVYHGGPRPLQRIRDDRFGADGELLCASTSVNVARRYGPAVSRFLVNAVQARRMSIKEFFADGKPFHGLRQEGVQLAIVTGEEDSYDFPRDTFFVMAPEAFTFDGVLTNEELFRLDDGLPVKNEPDGPSDRGWERFVADLHSDVWAALEPLDWEQLPDEGYRFAFPECQGRGYAIEVRRQGEHWEVAAGIAQRSGPIQKLEHALAVADIWRLTETVRRRAAEAISA